MGRAFGFSMPQWSPSCLCGQIATNMIVTGNDIGPEGAYFGPGATITCPAGHQIELGTCRWARTG